MLRLLSLGSKWTVLVTGEMPESGYSVPYAMKILLNEILAI